MPQETMIPEDPTQTLYALMPFAETLGLTVVRYEPTEVRARLAWAPELCTAGACCTAAC